MPVSGIYIEADEKSCGVREAYAKKVPNAAEEAKCYEEPVSGTSIQIYDNKMPASGTYIAGDDKNPRMLRWPNAMRRTRCQAFTFRLIIK